MLIARRKYKQPVYTWFRPAASTDPPAWHHNIILKFSLKNEFFDKGRNELIQPYKEPVGTAGDNFLFAFQHTINSLFSYFFRFQYGSSGDAFH